MDTCVFCHRNIPTRQHHIVPKSKGGTETVSACYSCEDFIHKTWDHNQLRDTYNNVDTIVADTRFQSFLKWLRRQPIGTDFRTKRNKLRTAHPYR